MKLVLAKVGDVADSQNFVNEVAGDFLGGEVLVKVTMREKNTSRSNNVLIKQVQSCAGRVGRSIGARSGRCVIHDESCCCHDRRHVAWLWVVGSVV